MPVSSLENEMTGSVFGIRTPHEHEYPTRPAQRAEKRLWGSRCEQKLYDYRSCAPSHQRGPGSGWKTPQSPGLLQFDSRALFLQPLLDRLGLILRDPFLHVTRGTIHQVLGFFQTQAGDFANRLD